MAPGLRLHGAAVARHHPIDVLTELLSPQESAKPHFAKQESDKTRNRNLLNHTLPNRNLLNPKSGIC